MSKTRTFETTLITSISWSGEVERKLVVSYNFTPAQPDTRDEPGHGDSVEIEGSQLFDKDGKDLDMPSWLVVEIEASTELREQLVADAIQADADAAAQAADYRADQARDDRMRGGW